MDPLDFLRDEELLQIFRCHKTELSCMENPHTFLTQLEDHSLIPGDRYERMSRMKSKVKMKQTLYEFLDWLERERSQSIRQFWTCVFKEPVVTHYPTLQKLRSSLIAGYEEKDERETDSARRKRKQRSSSVFEEKQASTSSPSTPSPRRKAKKICFSPPLKKGEKKAIWTWPIYKSQLPVKCGNTEGMLDRDKLAKGEKCIMHKNEWFTPSQFEGLAGKGSCKNWKLTVRCLGTPLKKLLEEGHLISTQSKGKLKKATKSLFPSDDSVTEEEGEMEKQTEQQPQASHGGGKKVFEVTCGDCAGTLHARRFASGTRGKSIRIEMSWMTPVEFTEKALRNRDASWKKYITYEGKPLIVLIQADILRIHSPLCNCQNCKRDSKTLEDQENDDECFICKSDREPFVVCDHCPRSFHQNCHLPHIDDTIVGDGAPWMCTFCVYRANQEDCEREREAATSLQISPHMLKCQYLLLRLFGADEEQTFATDPSLHLPDYWARIETPMWLGHIADKLQRQLYQTVREFVSDVRLIFTNCATIYRENAAFLAKGDRLKKLFDKELKTVFNDCD